jgi:hypothetical protein
MLPRRAWPSQPLISDAFDALGSEHVARHPEDVGLTAEDFNWILRTIARPASDANGLTMMRLFQGRQL